MSQKQLLEEVGMKLGFSPALEAVGSARLESLHTIYRFNDGACTEVERRRDCMPVDGRLVGMRLVAWLVENDEGRFLTHEWQQGARGVLWRSVGTGGTVAMTSPTFAFVRDRALSSANTQAATKVAPPRPPMQSMTRLLEPLMVEAACTQQAQ